MAFHKPNLILVLLIWFVATIPSESSFGFPPQAKEESTSTQPQESKTKARIIDSQGMGVPDAKVELLPAQIGDQIPILSKLVKATKPVTSKTDAEGWFEFSNFDLSSGNQIRVTGPGIVPALLTAESFRDIPSNGTVLVVQPARTVTGTVFDRTSKKPIPHVVVGMRNGMSQVEVDESGKFELSGLPAFQPLILVANPKSDVAYHSIGVPVPITQGFDATQMDIELEKGVWVNCQVQDFVTNEPAKNLTVYYFPTQENKQFQSFAESIQSQGIAPSRSTDESGNAKIVAVPGPGVVVLVAPGFPSSERINKLTPERRNMLNQIAGPVLTDVQWIEPKDLNDEVELSFVVSTGRTIEVELAGKEFDEADQFVVHRADSKTSYSKAVKGPKFVAEQFHPGETRQVLIHGSQQGLGAVLSLNANDKSPVKVNLDPTGSVLGQLVDESGDPQPGLLVKFEIETDAGTQEIATPIYTDANGRFEKPSLIASLDYQLSAIRPNKKQLNQMMMSSPDADARWVLAEKLKINSNEVVDLGKFVLGGKDQPEPKRIARTETVSKASSLPRLLSGVITNDSGGPMANTTIQLMTWPSRSGDLKQDSKLESSVLAQAVSDSGGNFQIPVGENLQEKLVTNADGKTNAALLIIAEKYGVMQIPLSEIADPQKLDLKMTREMVVRGKLMVSDGIELEKMTLICDSKISVYDVKTLEKVIAGLKEGASLEATTESLKPRSYLDPLVGGVPLVWKTSSSGAFLVTKIPINCAFKLHALSDSGEQKTIVVVSRPIRGFEFKPKDDSANQMELQGSRVKFNFSLNQK